MTTKTNTKELGKDLQGILEEVLEIKTNNPTATKIVEKLVDAIFDRVNNGEIVKLGAYLDLEPKTRKARKGLNPSLYNDLLEQGVPKNEAKKQAEIDVAEKRVVGLNLHKKLNDLLNG